MPIWIQVLQALLTPAIAVAVGVIAFLQWRTAHQKVILDLFDRRIAVFNKSRDFYLTVMRHGVHQDPVDVGRFHHVRNEAAFLFGKEISELLERFHVALINMSTQALMAKDVDNEDHSSHVRASYNHMKEAIALADQFESRFAPYMRMDQKRIQTPAEWLEERNRIRLSYADEKQQ
ncbi:hypothetical protein ELI00_15455 [Rhizobium ruizarguesonis]|uniref:hypothetical protein n=1 Tax=Rhizobium ruizarguesonis TaxID=2081791 RepID=UPI0010311F6E|nr:hypothetical protein [Rhizobium ruizarguesonis]TAX77525.1 hypothetical protein ELI00_15455 [Rhizobium ruizarguesonis]